MLINLPNFLRLSLQGGTCRLSRSAPVSPAPCAGPPVEEMHGFAFPNDQSCACKDSDGGADGIKPDDGVDDGVDDKSDDQRSGINIHFLQYATPPLDFHLFEEVILLLT